MLWALKHPNRFSLVAAFQPGGLVFPQRKPQQLGAGALHRSAWASLIRKPRLFNSFLNATSWLVQPLTHTFWLRSLPTWDHIKISKGAFRLSLLPWEATGAYWTDERSRNSCLAELKPALRLWSFPQTARASLGFLVLHHSSANFNSLDLGFFFPARPFTPSLAKLYRNKSLSNFFFRQPRPRTGFSDISAAWAKASLGRREAYGISLADNIAGLLEHPIFDAVPLQTLDCRAVTSGSVGRHSASLTSPRSELGLRPNRIGGQGLTRLVQLQDFKSRGRQANFFKKGSALAENVKGTKAAFYSSRPLTQFASRGVHASLIPYVKYKPGFLSEWRTCRQLFLACMHLPAWRQHRLTRFVSSLVRLTAFSFIRLLWLSLGFIAHHSALAEVFVDGWVSVRAGVWAVNGVSSINPFYQLYQGDWLCYYRPKHSLSQPHLSKTRQEYSVENLCFMGFGTTLTYTEVDELTQTVTVIFEPLHCPVRLGLGGMFPFSTLRMYNWKYTT